MNKTTLLPSVALVSLFAMALTFSACQKKDSGSSAVLPPAQAVHSFGACTGCPVNPTVVVAAPSTHISGLRFQFTVLGEAADVALAQTSGQNPQSRYQGIIAVAGTLSVTSPLQVGQCLIQPGQYALSTLEGGIMTGRSFYLPAFQAVGPTSFLMSLDGGTLDPNADGVMDRIDGTLNVLQINNLAYPGPTPAPYAAGLINCNNPVPFYLN
jgi:hypothetical protein